MNMNKKKNIKFKILLIITLVTLSIMLSTKVFQNDTFYTIKVGETIVNNGVDMKEHFAWTKGLEYTYPHWLYDVFIYITYDLFGFFGIYVSTIILALILLTTMYITSNKIIKDKGISYLLVLFISITLKPYITARAQLVSYILLLLIVYSIEMLKENNKKKYILYIVLSSLIIANIHCAVWPFIVILFLPTLTSELIYYIKNKKNKKQYELVDNKIIIEKNNNFKNIINSLILAIFTGFLTPNFLVPFTYLIKTKQGVTLSHISEHLPQTITGKPFLFVIIGLILFLLLQPKMKIKLNDLFLFAGLSILALLSRRSYALFAILLIFVIGRIVKDYIYNNFKVSFEFILSNSISFAVLTCLLISSCFVVCKYQLKKDYIDSTKYPVELSEYILKEYNLNEIRIFNEYNFGSYLLYRNIPVFFDSRADLYTEEFNEGCTLFKDGVGLYSKYEEVFNKYEITHIIIYKTNKLKIVLDLDKNYSQVYEDDYFIMYHKIDNQQVL